MPQSHARKKKAPKRVLALPDLEQAKSAVVNSLSSTSGQRTYDHAMLAMLLGCGLRRGELLALTLESLQRREEHWVIADLLRKGGHVRTVPIHAWVKDTVDAWVTAAGIAHGRVFRAINKAGQVWGDGMTPKVIWELAPNCTTPRKTRGYGGRSSATDDARLGQTSTITGTNHSRPDAAKRNPLPRAIGYDRRYGSKAEYKSVYREGFRSGYEEAYRHDPHISGSLSGQPSGKMSGAPFCVHRSAASVSSSVRSH